MGKKRSGVRSAAAVGRGAVGTTRRGGISGPVTYPPEGPRERTEHVGQLQARRGHDLVHQGLHRGRLSKEGGEMKSVEGI
jgi:hypothetical protein